MRESVMELATNAYTFMLPFYVIAVAIALLIVLPLTFWKKSRGVAGVSLIVLSYVFGLTTWLLGSAVTFGSFGWFGLIFGLLILGIGVVPLGIIGAFFKLDSGPLAITLIVMVLVSLSARFAGVYAVSKSET